MARLSDMELDEPRFQAMLRDPALREAFEKHSGVRHRKKLDERLVLEKVYGGRSLEEVLWCERPDFVLRLEHEDRGFGVEIVRLYESESAARLHELPGYFEHLLTGGSVRHKNDLTGFSVGKIDILAENGAIVAANEPAIVNEQPSVADCIRLACGIIDAKEGIFPLSADVRHSNLIVDDRMGVLSTTGASDFYRLFCTEEVQHVTLRSRFREIFFVTRFGSGPAYVPLKMLLTLARLFFFHEAVRKSGRTEAIGLPEYMALFAAYLRTLADAPIGLRREGDSAEVLYGDSGFMVSEDLETTVRSYCDAEWPGDTKGGVTAAVLPDDVRSLLETIERENTFTSPIAFPCQGSSQP